MERCIICGRNEDKVKLIDTISGNELVKICKECSTNEDNPMITKPTTTQLRKTEKSYPIRKRLERMAGIDKNKERKKVKDSLESLRKKNKREQLEEKYKMVKKENKPLKLVNNYHWKVLMARRRKKISRRQLADELEESEMAIKMIENKELPEDPKQIISKLEQFLNIKLKKEEENKKMDRKGGYKSRVKESVKKERLERKRAERAKKRRKKEIKQKLKKSRKKEKKRKLSFDNKSAKELTIADLKEMKEKKEKDKKRKKPKKTPTAAELLKEAKSKKKIKPKPQKKKKKDKKKGGMIGEEIELE